MIVDQWGNTSELPGKLVGNWSIDRVIEGQGTLRGLATFSRLDEDSLAYREQGNLRLPNDTELQTEREYIFKKRDGGFDVFFKENPPRLFHAIVLSPHVGGGVTGDGRHLCNFDYYRSSYSFLPDGSIVIRHVVSGPRKDYKMTTAYSRV
ncbi:hypothetical protein BSZ19_18410 [Bradyrhizobium japonicum]|uniref:DUF6314 domain-containing protein n=1 Tax=Bradyrhizobium japonicum TaxID=375 RepID=A0A1Y2JQ14_BRAJP|nr:DUF6314 family protein [Bradyrhizobium japonicum]OSJ32528.1 hypothetical protein BSZ19_18410 [Bradyrhizobium japonicum]